MPHCTICNVVESVLHEHHCIPRSRGGENGPTIDLCSSCHNILHANAVAVVAKVGGSKKPLKVFWKTETEERNAQPFLQILVQALLNNPVGNREHLISVSVSSDVFKQLKFLQQDLGISSMEKTLLFCIENSFRQRGITNEQHRQTSPETPMWFLPLLN